MCIQSQQRPALRRMREDQLLWSKQTESSSKSRLRSPRSAISSLLFKTQKKMKTFLISKTSWKVPHLKSSKVLQRRVLPARRNCSTCPYTSLLHKRSTDLKIQALGPLVLYDRYLTTPNYEKRSYHLQPAETRYQTHPWLRTTPHSISVSTYHLLISSHRISAYWTSTLLGLNHWYHIERGFKPPRAEMGPNAMNMWKETKPHRSI